MSARPKINNERTVETKRGRLCTKTGKRCMTRKESHREAGWWRHRRFARMNHYQCRACGYWHIGNAP